MNRYRAFACVVSVVTAGLVVGGFASQAEADTSTVLVQESFAAGTTNDSNWVLPAVTTAFPNQACLTDGDANATPIPACAQGTAGR